MFIKMLKSKLHRATVTDSQVDYQGSIAIDETLMKEAGIVPYESVMIADLTNGNRLETYAIPADADSGKIVVLGAAARLVKKDDVIIIFSFAYCTPDEASNWKPKVIILDSKNKIKSKT